MATARPLSSWSSPTRRRPCCGSARRSTCTQQRPLFLTRRALPRRCGAPLRLERGCPRARRCWRARRKSSACARRLRRRPRRCARRSWFTGGRSTGCGGARLSRARARSRNFRCCGRMHPACRTMLRRPWTCRASWPRWPRRTPTRTSFSCATARPPPRRACARSTRTTSSCACSTQRAASRWTASSCGCGSACCRRRRLSATAACRRRTAR